MRFGSRTLTLATLLLGAFFASPASATLIVTPGNGPVAGDDNVVSNVCDSPVDGPGLIIDGCLNTNHSIDVRFESNENIYFGAGGQAVILPEDELGFNFLKISIVGNSFDSLILSIFAENDGSVVFKNDLGDVSAAFSLDGNGQNFFTIGGDTFSWISLTSTDTLFNIGTNQDPELVQDGDVNDVRQVRLLVHVACPVGTDCANEVPEPATLALLGAGLAGLAIVRRRRKAKA